MRNGNVISFSNVFFVATIMFSFSCYVNASGDELRPELKNPVISPDGKHIAYELESSENSAIWIANRDGSSPRKLLEWADANQLAPDWAIDGSHLLFESDLNSDKFDIWKSNLDGSNPVRLTQNSGMNENPRYSPDGSKILFTSNRTGKREVWYMNADGSNQRAVGLQSLIVDNPAWSPDGSEIVFSGCTRPPVGGSFEEGTCNIFKIALDASSAKQLTFGQGADWNPDWGDAGIIFTSSKSGYNLMLIDANGNNPQQVTNISGLALYPRWEHGTGNILFSWSGNAAVSDISGNVKKVIDVNQSYALGDFNKDGCVDRADYDILMSNIRSGIHNETYDINSDGAVNRADARTLVGFFSNPKGDACQ